MKILNIFVLQLGDWVAEKTLAAQDETYRDAKSIHSKYMRHQAFELEIKSNKNQLEKLIKDGEQLIAEKPELAKVCSVIQQSTRVDSCIHGHLATQFKPYLQHYFKTVAQFDFELRECWNLS